LKPVEACVDMRVKWDWMKYKTRQESISYSKLKAKERREKLQTIQNKLKICEEKIAESPTDENLVNLEAVKAEYEREYDYIRGYHGIMTAIDFEKAFDSVNWNFLLKSLETFGFGECFIAWIKMFYKNISSCVTNNGFSTPFFNLKRGVRQGDPLSPSLFIIVLELLAISVRNNDQIRGIMVDGNELKLVVFADDMTSFVRDKQSHLALFNTIKLFSTYSGLCLNHDKTDILLLGNMEMKCSDLGVKEISKVIKILGVHFTHNYSLFCKMNFETIEKSLKESLKGWN